MSKSGQLPCLKGGEHMDAYKKPDFNKEEDIKEFSVEQDLCDFFPTLCEEAPLTYWVPPT